MRRSKNMGTVTKTRKPAKKAKTIKPTRTREKITFADWDPAEAIETKEDVISLLEVSIEENDPDFLLSVVGDIARSKGMTQIAKELNLDRKGLYKSLAPDGNPSFKTVYKLLDILGLRMKLEKKSA
jgi:probable addiction module antidote protein